jgi:cysteine desulfurase
VIERAGGTDDFDYVRRHVTGPAGMTSTDGYELDAVNPNLAVGYERQRTPEGAAVRNNVFAHVLHGGPGARSATGVNMCQSRPGPLASERTRRMSTESWRLGLPGRGQARLHLRRRKGQVAYEVSMSAPAAIRRTPSRLRQEAADQLRLERMKQRPLVQDTVTPAQLRAARDLALAEGEVGVAAEREPRQVQGIDQPASDEPLTRRDVTERRPSVVGEDEAEAQAARAQEHRSASGHAPMDRHARRRTRDGVDLVLDASSPSHDGREAVRLPEAQGLERRGRVAGPAGVLEGAEERLVAREVGVDTPQREVEQAHEGEGADHTTAVYLDCAATTPLDPRVAAVVRHLLEGDCGNAGSRSHDHGRRARRAVEHARDQVASVAGVGRGEIVFTSGATESDNLALLGLARHGLASGHRHVVSTAIEHHAVLEPLRALGQLGFEVTLVAVRPDGWVEPEAVRAAVRADTLLVSVMHVNNETGVVQPIVEIAESLAGHDAYFHVDAAQGFGKDLEALRHPRLDLVSVSAHKLHGPQGVGALVARRRDGRRPPLTPLFHGGGQELGLRPGTLPVALIAGFGEAAALAAAEASDRAERCRATRRLLLDGLGPLEPLVNGDPERTIPHILNLSFPGLEAEQVMEAWADLAAVSDGAACTTQSQTCSHVLAAMSIADERAAGAVRLSWSHLTPVPDVGAMAAALRRARA